MFLEFVLLVLLVAFLILLFRGGQRKPFALGDDFPPGTHQFQSWNIWGLEFSSGLSSQWTTLETWKKQHGDIVSIQLANTDVVVLHGHSLVKEAFTDSKFASRASLGTTTNPVSVQALGKGLTHSSGKHWAQQRKFVLKNFRDLGVGKQSLESMIHEELNELVNSVKQSLAQPLNIHQQLNLLLLNSLWHLIVGERHSSLDCSSLALLERNLNILAKESKRGLLGGLEFTKPDWIGQLLSFNSFTGKQSTTEETAYKEVKAFIQTEIEQHKNTYEDDNLRDFVDLYIREINDTGDKESSFYRRLGG